MNESLGDAWDLSKRLKLALFLASVLSGTLCQESLKHPAWKSLRQGQGRAMELLDQRWVILTPAANLVKQLMDAKSSARLTCRAIPDRGRLIGFE